MGVPKDWTGQRFGILTALHITDKRRGHGIIWVFQCDCGNTCEKVASDVNKDAKMGRTPSCGCLHHKHRVEAGYRHGKCFDPLYHIWVGMKQRCRDKNLKKYCDYGGRGIKVCDRWLNSFQNFYDDMFPTWKEGLTLDRIDVNGDYCPENCRWADMKTQQRNKRNNHIVQGVTVTELAERCGVDRGTIYARLRNGATEEEASLPIGEYKERRKANATIAPA